MSAASGRRYDGEVRGRPYSRIDRQHLEQFMTEVIGSVDLCPSFRGGCLSCLSKSYMLLILPCKR